LILFFYYSFVNEQLTYCDIEHLKQVKCYKTEQQDSKLQQRCHSNLRPLLISTR